MEMEIEHKYEGDIQIQNIEEDDQLNLRTIGKSASFTEDDNNFSVSFNNISMH